MSRPSCTAIIIYPPHTRYLSMLLHGAKEYSNSSSRINKHIFAEFSSAVSRKERDRGNWLRLWKLVNHDGAPPVKIGKRGGNRFLGNSCSSATKGTTMAELVAGKLRLWRSPPAFRGRKKARGRARERLVNSSRSAPMKDNPSINPPRKTFDLTPVLASRVERTVNAKIQPLRPCLDAWPSIIDPASAMG